MVWCCLFFRSLFVLSCTNQIINYFIGAEMKNTIYRNRKFEQNVMVMKSLNHSYYASRMESILLFLSLCVFCMFIIILQWRLHASQRWKLYRNIDEKSRESFNFNLNLALYTHQHNNGRTNCATRIVNCVFFLFISFLKHQLEILSIARWGKKMMRIIRWIKHGRKPKTKTQFRDSCTADDEHAYVQRKHT